MRHKEVLPPQETQPSQLTALNSIKRRRLIANQVDSLPQKLLQPVAMEVQRKEEK